MKKIQTLVSLLLVILCLTLVSCNNGDELDPFAFNGSDPIIKEFRIGNVPITNGGTFVVPLNESSSLTFILSEEIDPITFVDFFDMSISVHNQDTDGTLFLRKATMLENGSFSYIPELRQLEYRLSHTMGTVIVGGTPFIFAQPGDTLTVTVDFLVGRNKFGFWFNYSLDKFKIVYAASN